MVTNHKAIYRRLFFSNLRIFQNCFLFHVAMAGGGGPICEHLAILVASICQTNQITQSPLPVPQKDICTCLGQTNSSQRFRDFTQHTKEKTFCFLYVLDVSICLQSSWCLHPIPYGGHGYNVVGTETGAGIRKGEMEGERNCLSGYCHM